MNTMSAANPVEKYDRQSFEAFVARVESSANSLLGNHPARNEILEACDAAVARCEKVTAVRSLDLPVIALLGLKGQGKSWCARAMMLDAKAREAVPSGILTAEATTKLFWIGPQSPSGLDSNSENFLPVDSSMLLALPFKYMLLDTPGWTDANPSAAKIAAAAVSLAPVVLMVTRHDQMPNAAVSMLAHRAEGCIVLPVITAVESDLLTNQADVDANVELQPAAGLAKQTQRWSAMLQESAHDSSWLTPIYIEDFEESGDEETAAKRLRMMVAKRLADINPTAIKQSQHRRVAAIGSQLKQDVGRKIMEQTPGLSLAVKQLRESADRIPLQTIESVMGSEQILNVAIRNQLRTGWVAETPAIFFPYRTVLSVLSLTHGAWDRILLAMTGSLPSLLGGLARVTRNAVESGKAQSELREGLQQRIDTQVAALLQPIYDTFKHELRRLRHSIADRSEGISVAMQEAPPSAPMRLTGVNQLQLQSTRIFEQELERAKFSGSFILGVAAIGTLLFWIFFTGPMVSVYRDYLWASWQAVTASERSIESFPTPPASLFFTSLVLSGLPLAIYCMFMMSIRLSRRRIGRIAAAITTSHQELVRNLRGQGLLQLDLVDRELSDAEFLVNLDE